MNAETGTQASAGGSATYIKPLDTVRITRLLMPREADVGAVNAHVPTVGDIGTVIKVFPDTRNRRFYRVEAVDDTGHVAWVADFDEREIALADGEI